MNFVVGIFFAFKECLKVYGDSYLQLGYSLLTL